MKVIIAGSRSLKTEDISIIDKAVYFLLDGEITEVVSGTAQGIDELGEEWAEVNNIPVTRFPADWTTFKQAAGFVRNVKMAQYADILLAIWDGQSKGTAHMIESMKKEGKPVYVYRTDEN